MNNEISLAGLFDRTIVIRRHPLQWLRTHPFLVLGLLTLALFLVGEQLGNRVPELVQTGLRPLIIPMYVVWLAFAFGQVAVFGPEPTTISWLFWIASLLAGLAPYVCLDLVFQRWRARSHQQENLREL